jgi:predicted dehydrogenase
VTAQRRLRVAVIGCGHIGLSGHLPAFAAAARAGHCTIAGVCDTIPERAARAAQQFETAAYQSVDELLGRARPDVVSIATLPPSHLPLTLQSLAAGCHVLCEKPVAMDQAEAAAMVAAAQRAGRNLSICFEYRYWDEAVYLRRRIAAGDLGHVYAVRTWGGAPRGYPDDPARYQLAAAGGGVLTHWTIHNLDLALWLLGGSEPLTASAFDYQRLHRVPFAAGAMRESSVEDFAAGMVRLAGGTVLTVEANWLQPPSARPEGWELLADGGAASISPLRLWTDGGGEWAAGALPALAPCDYDMTRLMTAFLERAAAGEPAPVGGEEILRIQRLMDGLYESARCGREVDFQAPAPHAQSRAQPNGRAAGLEQMGAASR